MGLRQSAADLGVWFPQREIGYLEVKTETGQTLEDGMTTFDDLLEDGDYGSESA